jgi:glyoxalase family protein
MVKGIHHITAISGDPQKTIDFYSGILGLRFVKRTVNFDDPYTYHLYFGNKSGDPGTIITFFPWGSNALKGRRGNGQVTTVGYSAPAESIEFWTERFTKDKIDFTGPFSRFNNEIILFEDTDGIENEIVFDASDKSDGWNNGDIPEKFSIRGFSTATLTIADVHATESLLVGTMGFKKSDESANRIRFSAGNELQGSSIDLLIYPDNLPGRMGVGAVHHIAFRVENEEVQNEMRSELIKSGFSVTPVIDRNYFKSIYFREPGSVLFEIATDPPGFLIDETIEKLGSDLKLPEWYENIRSNIENKLEPIKIPGIDK